MKKSYPITVTLLLIATFLMSFNVSERNKETFSEQNTHIATEYDSEIAQELSVSSVNNCEQKYDFMMNVLGNPTFTIGEFLSAGLNPNTAQLQDISVYLNSKNVREDYRKYIGGNPTPQNIRNAYYKILSAWNILKQVYANYDMNTITKVTYSAKARSSNIFAQGVVGNNSELARKLSIVPLNQ